MAVDVHAEWTKDGDALVVFVRAEPGGDGVDDVVDGLGVGEVDLLGVAAVEGEGQDAGVDPDAAGAVEVGQAGVLGEVGVEVGGAADACGGGAQEGAAADGDGDVAADVEVGEEAVALAAVAVAGEEGLERLGLGRAAAEDVADAGFAVADLVEPLDE